MQRIFLLEGDALDESGLRAKDTYSVDCWSACFCPDLWHRNCHKRASVTVKSLPLSDQHWIILGRLSIDTVYLEQMNVPWGYLENTQASSVSLQESQLERPSEPTFPVKTAIEVSFAHDDVSVLDSPEKVDRLLEMWLSVSWSIDFTCLEFTEAMWKYLWNSHVLMNDRNCKHLAFSSCDINGRNLDAEAHSIVPMASWMIKEFTCLPNLTSAIIREDELFPARNESAT